MIGMSDKMKILRPGSRMQLTNQTVYKIMHKSQPKPKKRFQYPILNYQTESTQQISFTKHEKWKTLQKQQKKSKLQKKYKTIHTHHYSLQQISISQQKQTKNQHFLKQKEKSYEMQMQKHSENFIQKASKIKSIKFKKYIKNKFALGVKKISAFPPKSEYLHNFQNIKKISRNEVHQSQSKIQNVSVSPRVNDNRLSLNKIIKKKVVKNKFSNSKLQLELQNHTNTLDSKPHLRLIKQLELLDIFLQSFNCRNSNFKKQLQPYTKNNNLKYKYYVGVGNNRNLIRQMLRKRWWWVETNKMQEANLVWTQLKENKIIYNIQKGQNQLSKPCLILSEKILKKQGLKLFHHDCKNYKKLNMLLNITKTQIIQTPKILHNHYEANYMLGNKKGLLQNLSQFCRYKDYNKYEFIPLTFHIQKNNEKQFKQFEKQYKKHKYFWIVKPGENSNQGKGIYLTKEIKQIKKTIKKTKNQSIVVQKYISNVFLFNKRKFDIRAYFLAITINGIMKFYWYDEGYLRTCSYTYDITDNDTLVHLTNDAIQVQSEKYSEYEIGNKISYNDFQRYLKQYYIQKNYCVENLHLRMKDIAKIAAQSIYNKIDPNNSKFGFELFGLDFIIDDHFKPWLIQVNTNPCLQIPSPVLERLIPQMIENIFRISVDSVFPPTMQFPRTMAVFIPEHIFQYNKFQILFDSLYDRDFDWEFECSQKEKIKYIEQVQIYEQINQL